MVLALPKYTLEGALTRDIFSTTTAATSLVNNKTPSSVAHYGSTHPVSAEQLTQSIKIAAANTNGYKFPPGLALPPLPRNSEPASELTSQPPETKQTIASGSTKTAKTVTSERERSLARKHKHNRNLVLYHCRFGCDVGNGLRSGEELRYHMASKHQLFPDIKFAESLKCRCGEKFGRKCDREKHDGRKVMFCNKVFDATRPAYNKPYPTTREGRADTWALPRDGPVSNTLIFGLEHIPGRTTPGKKTPTKHEVVDLTSDDASTASASTQIDSDNTDQVNNQTGVQVLHDKLQAVSQEATTGPTYHPFGFKTDEPAPGQFNMPTQVMNDVTTLPTLWPYGRPTQTLAANEVIPEGFFDWVNDPNDTSACPAPMYDLLWSDNL